MEHLYGRQRREARQGQKIKFQRLVRSNTGLYMRPTDPTSRPRRSAPSSAWCGGRHRPSAVLLLALVWLGCGESAPPERSCTAADRGAPAAGFLLQICSRDGAGDIWRQVQDQRTGRWIELPEAPSRVVSQALVADEILADLLPPDDRARLVAVSAYAASERYSDLGEFATAIGTTVTNKTEEILALRPDLVFAASYSTAETIKQLEGAGIRTVILHRFDSVDAIRDNVRLVAFVLGLDQQGLVLETALDDKVERAAQRVRAAVGDDPPRALVYGSGAAHAQGTLMDDLLQRFGLPNPAAEAGLRAWPTINQEHLIDWQPEVIFLSAPRGREERVQRLFRSRFSEFDSAPTRTRLVTVPETLWSTVSHRVGDLALLLAEGFTDLDADGTPPVRPSGG